MKQGFGDWFDCGTTFPLSQTVYPRVEQNFSPFLTDASLLEGRIFNSHHPLSQDVRQVCRIGERKSIFRSRGIFSCVGDPVLQWRPIVDLCFQSIARSNRPDAGRCSSQNYIARRQSHRLTGERNDLRDRIDHLTRACPLPGRSVLTELDQKITNIDTRIDERTNRCVSVE